MSSRARLAVVIALAVAVAFCAPLYASAVTAKMTRVFVDDFRHYYMGAWILRSGVSVLYDQPGFELFCKHFQVWPVTTLTKSSPFLFLMFVPFTSMPLFEGTRAFVVINHLLLFVSVWLAVSLYGGRAWMAAVLSLAALCFSPFLDNLLQGQLNVIVLACTLGGIVLALRDRAPGAGFLLAVAVCAKVFPLLIAIYFALRGRRGVLGWCVFFSVALNLLTGAIYGMGYLISFVNVLGRSVAPPASFENQSLGTLMGVMVRDAALGQVLGTVLAVLVVGLTARSLYRAPRAPMDEIAVVLVLQFFVSSYSWPAHQISALVPLYGAFVRAFRGAMSTALATGFSLVYVIIACLDGFVSRVPWVQSVQGTAMEYRVPVVALLVLWALLLRQPVGQAAGNVHTSS